MNFPKQRFTFKVIQQIFIFIFYFCLLKFTSYLFYPLTDLQSFEIALFVIAVELVAIYVEFVDSNRITQILVELFDSLKWFALMYAFLALAIFIFNLAIFQISVAYDRWLLILIVLLYVYGYYNAHNPQITERILYLDDLNEEIDIVHLSDIHVGSIRRQGLLKKIADKINEINPDVVIISGDLADGSNRIKVDDFEPLSKINAQVIFTPGNHDYYTGIENVFEACENAGITVLDNAKTEIGDLNVFGFSFAGDSPEFDIDRNENNLLIYHIPANWDEFIDCGFNIMLSGHTHGGQFYPANLWIKLVFPQLRGLFEKEGNYLNVSDGVGTMGPPLRIGTKAEVGLLKLRKKD